MEKQIIEKIQNKLPMDIKKFAISMGFLTMVLTACGKNVVDTTQTNPNPTQTVETQVTPVEEDPEVTIPVVEPTDPTNNTETNPVVEDKYPDATIEKTGDNSYVMHIDCPDNSNAEIIAQTANIYQFDIYLYGVETSGISPNLATAIAAYGMQIDSNNVYQINYDAYKDKPFAYYDPLAVYANTDPHATVVITDNPSAYPEDYYIKSTDMPNDFSTAKQIFRNCLDETHNVSLALLRYYAGPDAFEQVIDACTTATGLTREEICANYDANYVLKYDTTGIITNHNCVNDTLQYVAPGEPINISYFDENGNTTDYTYVREEVKTYGSIQP